jgi:heat shock protein HtpX
MNTLKTGLLLAALTVLFVLLGRMIWGVNGMIIAFALALVMNGVSYWFSDKMVLSMYNAREVGPGEAPELAQIVQELTQRAGLPMPRLYIIPTDTPNAFATGRDPNHAAVAVTEGIMRILNRDEIAGVLAHELAHVRNRDTLISTVAAAIAGAITLIAHWAQMMAFFGGYGGREDDERGSNPVAMLLLAILAPIAALIIQMAISRSREYQADATGAQFCGEPLALASALRKMEIASQQRPMPAQPATAHMFIINPLLGGFATLFSTHPSTDDRIARLEQMAGRRLSSTDYVWR